MATVKLGEITLNGKRYRLARQEKAQGAFGESARVWQAEMKDMASVRPHTTFWANNAEVRPGAIEGEYVVTWDDWSKGITGDHDQTAGKIHYTDMIDATQPGSLRQLSGGYQTVDTTTSWAGDAVAVVYNKNRSYVFAGQRLYQITSIQTRGTALMEDVTPAGYPTATPTHALRFGTQVLVGFGGSTTPLGVLTTVVSAPAYTASSPAAYADYFAIVDDRLWRATATNQVSNISSTGTPTSDAWIGTVSVGDSNVPITALNAYGRRLAVSKTDGLYLSSQDSTLLFEKVIDASAYEHPSNGKGTVVQGDEIYYPYEGGILRYRNGLVERVGPDIALTSLEQTDPGAQPNVHLSTLALRGPNIWGITEPSVWPKANPTAFWRYTKPGGVDTWNNYTPQVTDNDAGGSVTEAVLDSQDTAGNNNYFYIGYSGAFYGLQLYLSAQNTTAATLTIEYSTGSGTWNSVANALTYAFYPNDGTQRTDGGSAYTLNRSGVITWPQAPGNWTSVALSAAGSPPDATARFWLRLSVSAQLSAKVRVAECRVFNRAPIQWVMRGRRPERDDPGGAPIIWDTLQTISTFPRATAMAFIPQLGPSESGALLVCGRQYFQTLPLPDVGQARYYNSNQGYAYSTKSDCGFPQVLKQFVRFLVTGRSVVSGTRQPTIHYRLDESTTWVSVPLTYPATEGQPATQTTDFSGISGYRIQWRLTMGQSTADEQLEVNRIDLVFRERMTNKREIKMALDAAAGGGGSTGGWQPLVGTQITNLEALQSAAPVTLIDPLGRNITVSVTGVQYQEYTQKGLDLPEMLVQITAVEV